MTFNHKSYNLKYLTSPAPVNDATHYGVSITSPTITNGVTHWRVIGIHHLLPLENMSNHHVYLDALDENGNRVNPPARIGWTWQGRRPDERADPVPVDKPSNEAGANIAMFGGQVLTVWVADSAPSEVVSGLTARHPDEPLPDGSLLNTIGHHSFYVVFQRTRKADTVPPTPLPPIVVPSTVAQRLIELEHDMAVLKAKVTRLERKGR